MKGMKLGQRWSRFAKKASMQNTKREFEHSSELRHSKKSFDQSLTEALPDHLDSAKVRMLLHNTKIKFEAHMMLDKGNNDELEHLIERAVYHKATLKQLKERVSKEKDNPWFESNLDHSFEHWNYYLKTLEMIVEARQSLQFLTLPEKRAVQEARISTQAIARHPAPLE